MVAQSSGIPNYPLSFVSASGSQDGRRKNVGRHHELAKSRTLPTFSFSSVFARFSPRRSSRYNRRYHFIQMVAQPRSI